MFGGPAPLRLFYRSAKMHRMNRPRNDCAFAPPIGDILWNEARNILRTAVAKDASKPRNLAQAITNRFRPLGGMELALPARELVGKPPQSGR